MGFEELGDALNLIVSKLGPKDAAVLMCVSKRLLSLASDDALWLIFCSLELDLDSPQDPDGNPTSSFKRTYRLWREDFSMYPWSLVKRVKKCWDSLKNWLSENFPEARSTLRKGASEAGLKLVEDSLGVKLPLSTRVLYRFCDGQEISEDSLESILGSPLGLIGGYSFYNHLVNVYLLPLSQVISTTKEFVRQLGFTNQSKYIVVAASSTWSEKLFFLNCINGHLYVGTRNLSTDGEMMPCVSVPSRSSTHNSGDQRDAMLLWLEEHGRRLESGIIRLSSEGRYRSINLFPVTSPLCSNAVTNGVQIRASSVFVPELSDLQQESEKYWFSYSIRMSLQPEGCVLNGMPFSSCQLYWRRWIIRAKEAVVSDVNDEAVIGKYPLLSTYGKEFVYESCTPLPSSCGSIEGAFTFVPGRLTEPKGAPFDVEVARFPLEVPDYIF
ncbi:hypothetical protein Sjap_006022 [Stephania japonica]|uniref:ApaG domain-containing protein n=1 Tax=Stephania japonica TaxID=461633 RepID=A0AAP0K6T0_9MAGN